MEICRTSPARVPAPALAPRLTRFTRAARRPAPSRFARGPPIPRRTFHEEIASALACDRELKITLVDRQGERKSRRFRSAWSRASTAAPQCWRRAATSRVRRRRATPSRVSTPTARRSHWRLQRVRAEVHHVPDHLVRQRHPRHPGARRRVDRPSASPSRRSPARARPEQAGAHAVECLATDVLRRARVVRLNVSAGSARGASTRRASGRTP